MSEPCTDEHCYHVIINIEHEHHMPPTYKELADLLIELTEKYVANIDADESDWWFINCITPQGIPSYWDRAMKYRNLLRKNNI